MPGRITIREKVTYLSSHLTSTTLHQRALRVVYLNARLTHPGAIAVAKAKREGKVTQKAMVQAALDEKGWDAGPQELQGFIKETFGTELATNIISNYKSVIKRATGKGGKGGAKRGRKAGAQFSDLEAVRGLVDRLGAEQVKKLVDVAGMFA
jgi:hypothetical protein